MRYPPSANLSQVQTLFQNCLHTAFWYASTTSYIFDRQSRILFDHNLYSRDVSLGNRGLPGRVSSSTENFPALKALTYLKTVRIEMVWGPYIPHNSLNICFESIPPPQSSSSSSPNSQIPLEEKYFDQDNIYMCQPWWLACASDWWSGGDRFDPCQVWQHSLIMNYFLQSFSPFHWFKKGSCQFLANKCVQLRRLCLVR